MGTVCAVEEVAGSDRLAPRWTPGPGGMVTGVANIPTELSEKYPMRFELTVNMKTAKALGLAVPAEMVVRATRVIE